jgi:anthranilate phosphoribosyltransferase
MIRDVIQQLSEGGRPDREAAREALREIMRGEATPAQIAAFLTALALREPDPDIIVGCAEAMREASTKVAGATPDTIDIVGTGGDGARTFNISTAAALVAAAAGARVAKHGSRKASSRCGAADVLQALGVNIECGPERMAQGLKDIGLAFLFAITLHPAMKHAAGPRREIGIRTIFNILGPLSNPAGARRGVIGVYDRALVPVMAEALVGLGAERFWVVHGEDGLDELSLSGPSLVCEAGAEGVHTFVVTPKEAGLTPAPVEALAGGDAETNAALIRAILAGERGPPRDIVTLNAGAALVTAGLAPDLAGGVARAAAAIDSGAAAEKLQALIRFTAA